MLTIEIKKRIYDRDKENHNTPLLLWPTLNSWSSPTPGLSLDSFYVGETCILYPALWTYEHFLIIKIQKHNFYDRTIPKDDCTTIFLTTCYHRAFTVALCSDNPPWTRLCRRQPCFLWESLWWLSGSQLSAGRAASCQDATGLRGQLRPASATEPVGEVPSTPVLLSFDRLSSKDPPLPAPFIYSFSKGGGNKKLILIRCGLLLPQGKSAREWF